MSATVAIRRILHGASQRLVVVAPHTLASGYECRRSSHYAWLALVGWLLAAVIFGAAVCAWLRLPAERRANNIHTSAAGTFCPAAEPTRNDRLLVCRPVDAGQERLNGARHGHDRAPICGGSYAV